VSEQGNDNSNGAPRRVKFDPTINLGHVLTAGMFLVSTIAAWVTLDARVSQTARDLVRVEGEANRVAVRVENVLTEKITAVQANMNQTQIRTAEDVRAAQGDFERWGLSTANVSFGTLTNTTTNYLYVTVGVDGVLTGGFTTLAPIYQESGTPATTSGQYTFNIGEMKGYLGNGSTAPAVYLVFVGEAVTSGGNVTAVTAYAYNGRYDSGWTATLPASGAVISRNHNIGVVPDRGTLIIENTTTEYGYAVGDRVLLGIAGNNTAPQEWPVSVWANRKSGGYGGMGSASSAWVVQRPDNGAATGITPANWKHRVTFDRGWG